VNVSAPRTLTVSFVLLLPPPLRSPRRVCSEKRTLDFLGVTSGAKHTIVGLPEGDLIPHFHFMRNGLHIRVQGIKPADFGKPGARAD
jgi:hypothetical protein